MIGLGNRALQIPSVLFLKPDGEFLVGEAAERRGLTEPDRLAREFKRRIGDHVPIMVAGAPFSPQALTAQLLRWVVDRRHRADGRAARRGDLTHPANWGPFRLELLDQVAVMAGLGTDQPLHRTRSRRRPIRRPDPDQRPATRSRSMTWAAAPSTPACWRRPSTGFRALGTPEGVEHLGGVDFDEAVLRHVLAALTATPWTPTTPKSPSAWPGSAATASRPKRPSPPTSTPWSRSPCPG